MNPISSAAEITCPKENDNYRYCTCAENELELGTLILTCQGSGDNKKISDILDTFLWTPNVSSISRLILEQTEITRVPDQVKMLKQLKSVQLVGHRIPIIHSRSFVNSMLDETLTVTLNNNAIRKIEPGAFQG